MYGTNSSEKTRFTVRFSRVSRDFLVSSKRSDRQRSDRPSFPAESVGAIPFRTVCIFFFPAPVELFFFSPKHRHLVRVALSNQRFRPSPLSLLSLDSLGIPEPQPRTPNSLVRPTIVRCQLLSWCARWRKDRTHICLGCHTTIQNYLL